MSVQQSPNDAVALTSRAESRVAAEILHKLFDGFVKGLSVRLWTGETLKLGMGTPLFTLHFNRPETLSDLLLGADTLRLAEAYFRGELDVSGDLYAALALKDHDGFSRLTWLDRLGLGAKALQLKYFVRHETEALQGGERSLHGGDVQAHSRHENREAISFHYDVSNGFYRLWLDERMVYSCAYFQSADQSLEEAQVAKLDHICRKLRLKPGERFLDVGCGWGALVIHAARHYGVRAHGITLSRNQLELAQERIRAAGLEARVTVELKDYRDLAGEGVFDKVASVGMFEHVGLKNLPVYFGCVQRLLVPGGLFLNHGITHEEDGWDEALSTRFINRYVFPDGQLDRVSKVQCEMEHAQFEIWDVEGLRPHYALTLREWVRRLEANREEALQHVSEATYRVWRVYMAACALHFEQGDVGIYQILASKREVGSRPVPLTRGDLYGNAY